MALAREHAQPDGSLGGPMPALSWDQALLATRALLGCGEDLAGQLLAAARGEQFDDVLEIGPDGVARPAPITEDPPPLD
jgi:hypothetical protein